MIYFHVQAIVFYELAFHFNPHCAEACNNLGVIYKDRDNLDKAVECYQAIILHVFFYIWVGWGYKYFIQFAIACFTDGFVNQTKLLSVIKQSRSSLHCSGEHWLISTSVCVALLCPVVSNIFLDCSQGKMDAAASMIEKAIIANPTYAEAYNNLGPYSTSLLCV